MTVQRIEKWLKAAAYQTADDRTSDLHFTHARRARDLLYGRVAHEGHLDLLYRQVSGHVRQPRQQADR